MPQQISQNILPLVSQVPTPWKKVSHDRMTSAKMHPGVFTRCQYLLSSAQQLRSISPGCELIICICARTSLPQLVWPPKIADGVVAWRSGWRRAPAKRGSPAKPINSSGHQSPAAPAAAPRNACRNVSESSHQNWHLGNCCQKTCVLDILTDSNPSSQSIKSTLDLKELCISVHGPVSGPLHFQVFRCSSLTPFLWVLEKIEFECQSWLWAPHFRVDNGKLGTVSSLCNSQSAKHNYKQSIYRIPHFVHSETCLPHFATSQAACLFNATNDMTWTDSRFMAKSCDLKCQFFQTENQQPICLFQSVPIVQ